jgi:hypothetical protein
MTTPTVEEVLDAVAVRARVGAPSDDLEQLLVETALEIERQALQDAAVQAMRIIKILRTRHQPRLDDEQVSADPHE